MSRYSVTFCTPFIVRAKNSKCLHKCHGHQTWQLGRPRGQPHHQRWLRTDSTACTVDRRQVEQESRCFTCRCREAAVLLSRYEAQASWCPLLQGSSLAVTAISIWTFHSRVSFWAPSLVSASSSPGLAWWTKKESAVWSQLPLHGLWRYVSLWRQMRWNLVKEEWVQGRDVRADEQTGFVMRHSHW